MSVFSPDTTIESETTTVRIGSKVTVQEVDVDVNQLADPETYTIVQYNPDLLQNRVSNITPLGQALIGRQVGETVEYTVNEVRLSFKIISVDNSEVATNNL